MPTDAGRRAVWISTTSEAAWKRMRPEMRGRADADLEVTGREFQAWEGFGGCFNELGWRALESLPRRERERTLDALFRPDGPCRFNICRVPIGASDYAESWYSLNETPGDYAMKRFDISRDRGCLLRYVKAALARRPDITLFASPWSPPTWMKFPAACNYGKLVKTRRNLEAYALYLAKFVKAYAAEGVRIGRIFPQNEPDSDQKFPSCAWSGEELRDFIRDDLGPRFAREKLATEIWLGTIERPDYDAWVNVVLSDRKARAFVKGVAFQWAGKGAAQRTHQAWPDLSLMMSENECGDGKNTWTYAHYVFSQLHHYVSNGARSYVYWNMALAPGGLSTWGWRQNAMLTANAQTGRATPNPEFYVMSHASGFVDPGARVMELAGSWSADALAWRNPDGQVVIVAHNPFAEPRRVEVSSGDSRLVAELPPGSFNTLVL